LIESSHREEQPNGVFILLHTFTKKLTGKFEDEVRFFKGWIEGPKSVGTPFPTSAYTGRSMARHIDLASKLPVLEIGAGTGVITRAILKHGTPASRLYAVEYSADFAACLRENFPSVHIIEGDAFDLETTLGEQRRAIFDCVISAIPLLNFKPCERVDYIEMLLDRIPTGRPVVQVTYGPLSPVPKGVGSFTATRADFVFRNVPPAHIWTYKRLAS
jgi:phosphatidylethanolamine/phosphatidyl-N-methylethanolamine N-methyltransferase